MLRMCDYAFLQLCVPSARNKRDDPSSHSRHSIREKFPINQKNLFWMSVLKINWDAGDFIGFQRDNSQFILQKFDDKHFA